MQLCALSKELFLETEPLSRILPFCDLVSNQVCKYLLPHVDCNYPAFTYSGFFFAFSLSISNFFRLSFSRLCPEGELPQNCVFL